MVDGAMQGVKLQPSEAALGKLGAQIGSGTTDIDLLIPGIEDLGITTNQTAALITFISTWCYSPKALERLREALDEKPVAEWWKEYRNASRKTADSS